MPKLLVCADDDYLFQSAPGREAGRCAVQTYAGTILSEFQSAPGREAGRCASSRRAIPEYPCFNPRPAVRPGDAL